MNIEGEYIMLHSVCVAIVGVLYYISEGILFHSIFTCMNVMGRRIAMTIHEVMCDIRQAAD